MEPATLYLMYIAATGGPEKRVIQHYDSEQECREMLGNWERNAPGRYMITQGSCLTADEYNAKIGVITTDTLSNDRRI